MWIQEIINVVIENKNKNNIYEHSRWNNDNLNVIIQFLTCYKWVALELTSAQYEAIEEVLRKSLHHQVNEADRLL